MEDSGTFRDHAAPELGGLSGVVSGSSATARETDATNDYPSEECSIAKKPQEFEPQRTSELSDVGLSRSVTRSLSLEPPPVVVRPPKVRYDGFSSACLTWFAWFRNEQKDVPDCARATRRSYSYQSTFRLFGFSLTKDVTYKTSESGIDTAMAKVHMVSRSCRTHPWRWRG